MGKWVVGEQRFPRQAPRPARPSVPSARPKVKKVKPSSSTWYKTYWKTPRRLSKDLAAVCGKKTMSRTDVASAIWSYISKKKLLPSASRLPSAASARAASQPRDSRGFTKKPSTSSVVKLDAPLKKIFTMPSLDLNKYREAKRRPRHIVSIGGFVNNHLAEA